MMVMFLQKSSIGLLALSAIASLSFSVPAIANQRNEFPVPSSTIITETIAISETKRSLIYQMLELTGGEEMYRQMQQIVFTEMQNQFAPMMEQVLDNQTNLSPAEKAEQLAKLSSNVDRLIGEFAELMQSEIAYDEMLESVFYPVYDRYFTEEDLRGLIAFYESPVGQKIIAVSPDLFRTSLQLSNEIFVPRMLEIMDRLIQEEIGR
ncbi:DUF2059 domain-containing protein [Roseofilum casamattae]|uniref:DUF2059 domain-containing protein n=1 Tax=Roseofilum casamattae BLCC-M143 TaxID=3022442 RepID=A0ABT7BU33_9CYAN|nr:DUF2059 domain-containing protein [Roseofilum casamattae]MDJ1182699.1 DUF2059 domain-containing protein [Roseofilum casamattae BLCC-M143]